jgi:hypothetical protein
LGGISSFELQTITITNSKPHGLLDSSTLGFDGARFCSPIVRSNETTFSFELLNYHKFYLISFL